MSKPRIAIDARMIESSGIGRYIKNILQSGLYDTALGNASDIHKYNEGIDVIGFNERIYSIGEQLRFPFRIRRKYDLIHFPHYNVPVLYRGKFFVTIHDLTHLVFPELLPNRLARFYSGFLLRNAVNRSEFIFADSQATKNDIIRFFHVKESKISIARMGVDLDIFMPLGDSSLMEARKKYGLSTSCKYLMFTGNLKPHKNLARLLEAFSLVKRDIPNCKLLLVGKSFNDNTISALIEEKHLEKSVIITGYVPDDTLVALYNIADLFVFPSLYEGFGIPPLEAMACGTPCAVSSSSSIPEVVGDAGLYFNPYSVEEMAWTIEKGLTDEDVRSFLKKLGFENIKRFSWDKCISDMSAIIGRTEA